MKNFYTLFLLLTTCWSTMATNLDVYDLTCEHLVNPIGIETTRPRVSWKLKSSVRNTMQSTYHIRISDNPDFAKNIVWESGKVSSDASNLIALDGLKLEKRKRYYWQVKVWDNHSNESEWSNTAYWEMGLMDKSEWRAQWIEPDQEQVPNGTAVMMRKEFSLGRNVSKARIYVTAHGIYNMTINGEAVTDHLFTPGWTAYNDRLQYQVFDVTRLLQSGGNAMGVVLGEGWYKGELGWEDNFGIYGKRVGLLCQLEVTYTDGTTQVVITDDSWKSTSNGPITMNGIYDGEYYDARKEMSGWDKPGYKDKSWAKVNLATYSLDNLVASESVPVKKIEEIKPHKIWTTPKGTLVVDMGQNMVGWVKLKVQGDPGTTITIRHAEVLDKYGEFYTENLRSAAATLKYTLKGGDIEEYEPCLTFMGFRYIAVEGFPGTLTADNITGVVIHSDMEVTGSFECSNELINQLQHNIQWGQKGNFLDVPTDCPQRDERLGWTGDAQAFISTAAFNMDVAAFFTKWLKDVAAEQDERGAIPFVVPNALVGVQASAGWADVVTIAPWTIYQVYGDKALLAEMYPSMKKYVEYIRKEAGESYVWTNGSVFGDWLFYKPDPKNTTAHDGYTDHTLIATAFYAYSTELVKRAATVLGYEEDVRVYEKVLQNVKNAFNENFVTPAGRVSSDSQTAFVLALMFDLLPADKRPKAVNYLVNNIRGRENHLSTGFLGTPYLCHVLSENGKTDVAYDLLLQETYPSWIYPVKMGATTIWERWDGMKPDSTFQTKDMNSFNHYAYGAIGDWMYKVVAGLKIGAPGYKKIIIKPEPDGRLSYAKASIDSRYGTISSGWEIVNGELKMSVVIPPNTTAVITLPGTSVQKVKLDGKPLVEASSGAYDANGNVELEVGSGVYVFQYSISSNVK